MRTVIYCRISLDDKGDSLGVARQEKLCRQHAKQLGVTVDQVIVDNDVSAYSRRKRPGFEQLVTMMEDGLVDAVIVYHSDRLYRRRADLDRIVKIVAAHNVAVHTVAAGIVDLATASGRMVARVIGDIAEHESERIGERLKVKNDERALAGTPHGGRPPFGYGPGNIIDDREADIVRYCVNRVLEGASLLGVARELEEAGWGMRNGSLRWHHSRVRQIILKPSIAGLRVHRGEVVGVASWEPIIDRDTFERVRLVLADPARKVRRPARSYLLSRLVCSSAGDRMIGHHDSSGPRYATQHRATVSTSVNATQLEDWFEPVLLVHLGKFQLPPAPQPASTDVEQVEAEMDELARLRGEGVISLAEWMAARAPLQERLAVARGVFGERAPSVRLLESPGAVLAAWPRLGFGERREVLAEVVDRIVVGPATRGRWTSLEERVDPEKGFGPVWRA